MADPVLQQLKDRRDELLADLKRYEVAISALEGSGGVRRRGRPAGGAKAKGPGRPRGATVTKAELSKMLKSGMTGAEIAQKLGVSMPTVHNYKKKFGLTAPRGTARKKTASRKTAKRSTARRGKKA